MDLKTRFESHVRKTRGCWLWTGAVNWAGYGNFNAGKGRSSRAHRIAFELYCGPIPAGFLVLHNCPKGDNPACVNPNHLWLGTPLDNALDREAKGRGHNRAGEAHGYAKLTEKDVRKIRRDLRSSREIAADYGVHRGHISDIKSYKTWKHLKQLPGEEPVRGKGYRADTKK